MQEFRIDAVKQALYCFIKAVFADKDIKTIMCYVTNDIMCAGLGNTGIVNGYEDFKQMILQYQKLLVDVSYEIIYENVDSHVLSADIVSLCTVLKLSSFSNGRTKQSKVMISATFRKKNGSWCICVLHASPVLSFEESIEAYPIVYAESTLAKLRGELKLKAIDLISASIPGGIIGVYDEPDYPLYYINDSMLMYLGYKHDEFVKAIDRKIINTVHPKDRAMVNRQIKIAKNNGSEFEVRYRIIHKTGKELWVTERGRFGKSEAGKPIIISVYLDITQNVQLQNDLQEKARALEIKNAELTNLTNNVAGGVCTLSFDDNLTIIYANDFFYHMFGYTRVIMERKKQNNFAVCLMPEELQAFKRVINSAFLDKYPSFEFEAMGIKSYGYKLWILVRGSFLNTGNNVNIHCVILDITQRKQMEYALKQSEERFRIALKKTSCVIFDYDITKGKITHSNKPKRRNVQPKTNEERQESLILTGKLLPEYVDTFAKAFEHIQNGEKQVECIVEVKQPNGNRQWNKVSMTSVFDNFGNPVRAIGMIEDITHQKETEMAYRREEQYRKAFLANACASYIINFTKNQIERFKVDDTFCIMPKGNDPYNEYLLQNANTNIYGEDKKEYLNKFSIDTIKKAYASGKNDITIEYRCIKHDEKLVWMMSTLRIFIDNTNNDLKGFMYTVDIDVRKKEELLLTYKSERDSLTGLYNKGVAENKIRETLNNKAYIGPSVFLFLDVDRFKEVNDAYGHPFGDKVLKSAADGICALLKQGSIVGRIGGDEFGIFFRKKTISYESVCELANQLCIMFSHLTPKDAKVSISCSIGIAICQNTEKTFEMLYTEADKALYRVKEGGKNGYAFFDEKPYGLCNAPKAKFF